MSGKLDWRTKETNSGTGRPSGSLNRADVYFGRRKSGKSKDGKQRWAVGISFKAGVDKAITSSGYLKYAVLGDRLYLGQSDPIVGYKVGTYGTTGTRAVTKITDDALTEFAGRYSLKFDRAEGAYYIEKGAAL